ncbi:Uncharacterized protein YebE, UPF0316 family [Alteribacillus persepolensis]|uniref:UPF0316 protein SAMN05192534_11167 n=1 Tax=Alteribacillus persepolensis TaxID=568899 RepID=A0A1G8F6Y1_9BACI|nr:DUF5698 domain-containing protein [Alteribacillus persepolensis]SDH77894.1 Uncharacterized protein YebE, UPF0316 family [Alteribacillus persepolensis]
MLDVLLGNAWTMLLVIFSVNIVYVTLFTLRMIFTLKGQHYAAGAVGMIEIVVYVLGLGLVLDNLDHVLNLVAYAIGYGTGVVVGMKIEEKLALGYITVNVITKEYEPDIPNALRNRGYGVTNWVAYGREGERLMMQILTSRRSEPDLYNVIKSLDPKAFIISHEPKAFFGGFWVKGVRR